MTLVKAIEIVQDIINAHTSARTPDAIKAQQLGIEALKLIQAARTNLVDICLSHLPGETVE